jgi:Transcriptional activator of glycolytic enzymes
VTRNNPGSASAIYDEYYGRGRFEGIPTQGGLAGLEERYKNKWRVGDAAYLRSLSRMKQIVDAVDKESNKSGDKLETVLERMDELFATNRCMSSAAFVSVLQQNAFLPKRSRKAQRGG